MPAAVSMHDTMLSGSFRSASGAADGVGAGVPDVPAAVVGADVAAPEKLGPLVAAVVGAVVASCGG